MTDKQTQSSKNFLGAFILNSVYSFLDFKRDSILTCFYNCDKSNFETFLNGGQNGAFSVTPVVSTKKTQIDYS
jgi:hypothetical protein